MTTKKTSIPAVAPSSKMPAAEPTATQKDTIETPTVTQEKREEVVSSVKVDTSKVQPKIQELQMKLISQPNSIAPKQQDQDEW